MLMDKIGGRAGVDGDFTRYLIHCRERQVMFRLVYMTSIDPGIPAPSEVQTLTRSYLVPSKFDRKTFPIGSAKCGGKNGSNPAL